MPFDKPGPKVLRLEEGVITTLGVGDGVDANHLVLKWREISSGVALDCKFAAGRHSAILSSDSVRIGRSSHHWPRSNTPPVQLPPRARVSIPKRPESVLPLWV